MSFPTDLSVLYSSFSDPSETRLTFLPALHVQATLVGHQNFFFFLLDASFQSCVIAGIRRVADDRCIPEEENVRDDDGRTTKRNECYLYLKAKEDMLERPK